VLNETLAGGGIAKTTPLSGLLTITLATTDSSSLAYETHELDAELHGVDGSANLWKLAEGVVKIKPGAARTNP
jgi:hypothetical protein